MQKKSSYQGLALIQCTFAKFNVFKRHLFELPFRLITRDVISSRGVLNMISHWRSAKVVLVLCLCPWMPIFQSLCSLLRKWGGSGLLLGRGLHPPASSATVSFRRANLCLLFACVHGLSIVQRFCFLLCMWEANVFLTDARFARSCNLRTGEHLWEHLPGLFCRRCPSLADDLAVFCILVMSQLLYIAPCLCPLGLPLRAHPDLDLFSLHGSSWRNKSTHLDQNAVYAAYHFLENAHECVYIHR